MNVIKEDPATRTKVAAKWADELADIKIEDFGELTWANQLPKCEQDEIKRMLIQGYSFVEIAEETGHSETTVWKYRQELVRKGIKVGVLPPPYERKDIPYERETEIKMLTWTWGICSLDEQVGEIGRQRYDYFATTTLTPLDELIQREKDVEQDEFMKWLRSWIRGLPDRDAETAENLMYGAEVTEDDLKFLRGEAMQLFNKEPAAYKWTQENKKELK